jgi:hypothetical protein
MGKKLTFTQNGRQQKVFLDGEEISSAIRSISIEAEAWQAPVVSLELAVFEIESVVDQTKIHIADSTVDLLKRLGWTPPAEEAK